MIRSSMLTKPSFCVLVALALTLSVAPSSAQTPTFEPTPGQAGKDGRRVPTPAELVEKMLDMAHVTLSGHRDDLGSGDGRNVMPQAKRGGEGDRRRYNPEWWLCHDGWRGRRRIGSGNLHRRRHVRGGHLEGDGARACFICQQPRQAAPKFLALKPGTRIVNNTFQSRDGRLTTPKRLKAVAPAGVRVAEHRPARVAGTWRLGSNDLTRRRRFKWCRAPGRDGDRPMDVSTESRSHSTLVRRNTPVASQAIASKAPPLLLANRRSGRRPNRRVSPQSAQRAFSTTSRTRVDSCR